MAIVLNLNQHVSIFYEMFKYRCMLIEGLDRVKLINFPMELVMIQEYKKAFEKYNMFLPEALLEIIENRTLTPFEDSPLYPWCLCLPDEIMRIKDLIPYCLRKRNYIIFARRCDMDQVAAINPKVFPNVLEIHYQIGNLRFIEITDRFSSIPEWIKSIKP